MDLSIIEPLLPNLAACFNLEPSTMLLVFGVFVAVCNLVGRLIPDEVVGFLGAVRKVCKFVGMYTSNRVSKGVSVNDVAKALLDSKVPNVRDNSTGQFVAQTVEEVARDR